MPSFRGSKPFPSTHWSLIALAGGEKGAVKTEALAEFLRGYMVPLKSHLLNNRRLTQYQAEEVLQAFLCKDILERNIISRADRQRGKFRSFIVVALNHYTSNYFRDQNTAKSAPATGQIQLDAEKHAVDDAPQPSQIFEKLWAQQVLKEAIKRMEQNCTSIGRPDIWGVFQNRVLGPVFENQRPLSYSELVKLFGFQTPSIASNALVTAKRMFARSLRSVIGAYEPLDSDIDEEIADLRRIISE